MLFYNNWKIKKKLLTISTFRPKPRFETFEGGLYPAENARLNFNLSVFVYPAEIKEDKLVLLSSDVTVCLARQAKSSDIYTYVTIYPIEFQFYFFLLFERKVFF